jgi:hypothetical protein
MLPITCTLLARSLHGTSTWFQISSRSAGEIHGWGGTDFVDSTTIYLLLARHSISILLAIQMITKLDSDTVQRITSGQLILDVASTIKELIENAIDAKSTQITLILDEDGLSSISVLHLEN